MAGEAGELALLIERGRERRLEACPYYATALVYAARWRRRCGLTELRALPPGVIGSATENPVARALGPGASAERWWARLRHPDGRMGTVALPGAVEAFLERFHFGLYPSLVAGAPLRALDGEGAVHGRRAA